MKIKPVPGSTRAEDHSSLRAQPLDTDNFHDGISHYLDLNYLDVERDMLQKLKDKVKEALIQVLIDSRQNMGEVGEKLKEYSWQIINKIDLLNFNEDIIDSDTSLAFKRDLKNNIMEIFDKSIKQAADLNMIAKMVNIRNLKSELAGALVASGTAELMVSVRHERVKTLQQRLEKALDEMHILNDTFSEEDYERFQRFIKKLEEKIPVQSKGNKDDMYYEIETIDLSRPEPFQVDLQNHVKQLFSTVDMAKLFNRRMHGPALQNEEELNAFPKADKEVVLSINDSDDKQTDNQQQQEGDAAVEVETLVPNLEEENNSAK